MKPRVGWIGLGAIGAPMAHRVLDAGFGLSVWSRDRRKMAAFIDAGATAADHPAALACESDVVCVCVSDAAAVEAVLFGEQGVVQGMKPGCVVADLSTIGPFAARRCSERLAHAGGRWLDAPVSGGVAGARAGSLSVFAGGGEDALAMAQPVLAAFASRITHLGEAGAGQAGKVCNQMVSFGTAALLGEALHAAHRFGLDAGQLVQAMQGGFADSEVLRRCGAAMVAGRHAGSLHTAMKDMELAVELGRETHTPLPLAGLLASLFQLTALQGHDGGLTATMRLYVDGPLSGR